MIDPHWSVVDLDPRTWRAIGRFFDPGQYISAARPGEHGLFILHDNGTVLRIVDNVQGPRTDLDISFIDDPHKLALQLYERDEWQRVHIINRRHLAEVARKAQQFSNGTLNLDAYYRYIYQLLWGTDNSYVSVPPHPGHWNGWTYQGIQDFVHQLPSAATLALGVFEGSNLEIGLILEWHQHTIRKVTTFEALPEPQRITDVSSEALEQLWQQLGTQFAAPAGVLLCTQEVFDRWIETAEDKSRFLYTAREHGQAIWRLELL